MDVEIRILKHGTIFLSILRPTSKPASTITQHSNNNNGEKNNGATNNNDESSSSETETIARYAFGYSEASTRISCDQFHYHLYY